LSEDFVFEELWMPFNRIEMFQTEQVGPSDNTFDLNLGGVQIESQARAPAILTVFFGLSGQILR
jgi:hypothetical protein